MPPDDTDGLEDDDLPGLDDGRPSSEPKAPPEKAEPPEANPLDRVDEAIRKWETDLDAEQARRAAKTQAREDLQRQLDHLGDDISDLMPRSKAEHALVDRASIARYAAWDAYNEADDLESFKLVTDLINSASQELEIAAAAVPKRKRPPPASEVRPRFYFPVRITPLVVGGFGVFGLVLTAWLVFPRSSDPSQAADTSATNTEATAQDTLPPSTEAIVVNTDAPAGAPAAPDPASAAFPTTWNFTATKTASIVPAPDFISATPIGAVLPWSVAVTESCIGDACTSASVVRPLVPEAVEGEVPEVAWVVDGTEWSLEATWFARQASYPDGTVCLIEIRWTYRFTVTEAELINGRSVASAFVGTWVQANRLDLGTSTGDLAKCGDWEFVDEWSLVGVAAG